jgi:hypothetical protein
MTLGHAMVDRGGRCCAVSSVVRAVGASFVLQAMQIAIVVDDV